MRRSLQEYQQEQSKIEQTNLQDQNVEDESRKSYGKPQVSFRPINAYKALLEYLIDRNEMLIERFILESSQTRKNLAQYLRRVLNNIVQVSPLYSNSLEDLEKNLTEKINENWIILSEDERQRYNQIAERIMQKLQNFLEYNRKNLNGKDMLKLDILALFLERNNRYREVCHRIVSYFTLSQSLAKIFHLQISQVAFLLKQFDIIQGHLAYQFQEKYDDIITIFYMIQLKAKLSNFERRDRKSNDEDIDSIELLPEHLIAKGKANFDFRLRFNFCEVAFYPKIDPRKKPISLATVGKRSELIEKLKKITKLSSLTQMNQKLINIAVEYNASLSILNEWLEIIRNPQKQLYSQTFSREIKLINELERCQWSFVNNDHCLSLLNKLSGGALPLKEVYLQTKNRFITMSLIKHFIKRSQTLSKVLKTQLKLDQTVSIFINKYEYCYKDIVSCGDQPPNEEKQQNLKVTLVLGVQSYSVLFYSISRGELDRDQYCDIIKDFMKLKKLTAKTIVVWDEDLIGIQFYRLRQFVEGFCASKLFTTNEPGYFTYHSSTQVQLLQSLRKMETAITKQNFHMFVSIMISRYLEILSRRTIRKLRVKEQN